MLAHTASAQKKDPCREYMCHECGKIYQQAGYKIVKIPVPEASTSVAIKDECPTVTQEPVGPSKSLEKETKPQISRPVLVSSTTQTMPQPSTYNAGTQTLPWKQLELMNNWKKQYAVDQDKIL